MRTATRVGAAIAIAAAGLAVSHATSSAEPPAHKVKYTVTSGAPYDYELFYLTTQPADKAAYNADAYAYAKRDKVTITPDQPWVFETDLADPQWAILTVSSTTRGTVGQPNATCDITVDGQPATHQEHPYSPWCQLSQW